MARAGMHAESWDLRKLQEKDKAFIDLLHGGMIDLKRMQAVCRLAKLDTHGLKGELQKRLIAYSTALQLNRAGGIAYDQGPNKVMPPHAPTSLQCNALPGIAVGCALGVAVRACACDERGSGGQIE